MLLQCRQLFLMSPGIFLVGGWLSVQTRASGVLLPHTCGGAYLLVLVLQHGLQGSRTWLLNAACVVLSNSVN